MKKKIIYKCMSYMIAFIMLVFSGCSFVEDLFKEEPSFMYGDFHCCYVRDAYSTRSVTKEEATGVNIIALVEEAREKETIIIPETVNGLPVIASGMGGMTWSSSLQGHYKKLYIPSSLLNIYKNSVLDGKKIFLYDNVNFMNWGNRIVLLKDIKDGIHDLRIFVAETLYQDYQNLEGFNRLNCIHIANMTYIVDNVIYWIDDYKEGEYVQMPPMPSKDGFVFEGWYMDEIYANKWDFSVNQYKKAEEAVSLKLYAKFI